MQARAVIAALVDAVLAAPGQAVFNEEIAVTGRQRGRNVENLGITVSALNGSSASGMVERHCIRPRRRRSSAAVWR